MIDILSLFIQAVFAVSAGEKRKRDSVKDILSDEDLFSVADVKDYLHHEFAHLTEEKVEQIFSMYHNCWRKSPDGSDDSSFFYTLAHFVEQKVVLHNGELQVKLNELLRWRKLAYWVGEDMLVCGWMAYRYRWNSQIKWDDASWNMTCGLYDADFQYVYRHGLADLHHHLKASTDVFSLSWICLMNHIAHRYSAFGKIDGTVPELYLSCCKAASIRKALYAYTKGDNHDLQKINVFNVNTLFPESDIRSLQDELNMLRWENGYEKKGLIDYALPACCLTQEHISDVLDGEHSLLYAVLHDIYRGVSCRRILEQMIFEYLHIKCQLRRYLVQTSNNVGFANFAHYERRKDLFLEGFPEYERLLTVLPVAEGKRFHHIKYLETRIAPKSNFRKMKRSINDMIGEWKAQGLDADARLIVHFIKRNDETYQPFKERHHDLRNDLRRQAITLMNLRRRSSLFYYSLVGIDAANVELDCRPEVFAHAFRYVRNHDGDIEDFNPLDRTRQRTLHYTYHAGEDFYDILDGLRAIDEAIEFLNLKSGDRLGHCLALGLDPKVYYYEYDYKVVAKKQYLLDNVAWMLYKIQCASIDVSYSLLMLLKEKFSSLVFEIYQKNVSLEKYFASMQLRGDDPRHIALLGKQNLTILNDWESFATRKSERLDRFRTDVDIYGLFLDYHFKEYVRRVGNQMTCMSVGKDYVSCVRLLQNYMMEKLKKLNIIIECCPSSNMKIGLANRYEQQPIFRFAPINDYHNPMAVTVNTDDLGIFQTSIDNEYSLLALSALKAKDNDGNLKFSKMDVLKWIEFIRENGMKYTFGKQ